jgi:atypical dual specificity phosphatase
MRISWIEPGKLAASGIPYDAKDIRSLHEQGIRAILSLTEHPITNYKEITPELFKELDILYFHTPIQDNHAPDHVGAQRILRVVADMEREGRAVFVHCHAGVGRTGTVLHLYYLARGLNLEEAERVQSRRPQCILLSDDQLAFLKRFAELRR